VFYLLPSGTAEDALHETLKLTHNDRFVELPGYKTSRATITWPRPSMRWMRQKKGIGAQEPPEYVGV